MALSATFVADFSSFMDAVDKADAKLKTFEQDASKVNASLNKFGNQFSGQKVIQDAVLMEKAIQEIGGVSKLTEDELKRAGEAATAAMDKMKKMGIEVPPQLKKLADAAEAGGKQIGLMGRASELAKSQFGQMFSAFSAASLVDKAVGSLIDFGKAAFDSAGHIADLSDSTGLSIKAIQEMQYVATQTGSDLDTFAQSAQKLGVNLSTGTKQTKQAVDDLGLSFTQLRNATPEDAFRQVMQALSGVTDVNDRTRLGVELLGKSFTAMGAAAVANYAKTASAATTSSDDQIKALAAAGDAWDDLKSQLLTTVTTGLGNAWIAFNKFAQGFLDAADAVGAKLYKLSGGAVGVPRNLVTTGKTAPAPPPPPTKQPPHRDAEADTKAEKEKADALKASNAALDDQIARYEKITGLDTATSTLKDVQALKQLGGASKLTNEQLLPLEASIAKAADTFDRLNMPKQAAQMRAFQSTLPLATKDANKFTTALYDLTPKISDMTQELATIRDVNAFTSLERGADIATVSLEELGRQLGVVYTQIEHPPKPPSTLATAAGTALGSVKGWWDQMSGGKGIGGFMGNIAGDLATGGLTAALNAGLSLATKGIQKLWGSLTQSEGKKTNDVRDEFIKKNFGTEDALRKLAFQAGATEQQVRAIFSTKTVESFQAAMGVVQGQMDTFTNDQEADAARLESAIQKYGFAIEELGPALQKQKLDEQSKDLIEDWRVLIDAGVDVGKVNEKMAASVNDFIAVAKKTGTEVPAAMKPMLESMIKQGTLTDEAGNQIKDLQSAGVTFSETLTQGFDRVVKKLDEMLKKIGGVGTAIDQIPDTVETDVIVRVGGTNDDGTVDLSGSIDPNGKFRKFNDGTRGRFLDFGSGTPAMLHGKERIVTEDEIGMQTEGVQAIVDAVQALHFSLLRSMRDNAMMTRDQIQLARA